MLTQAIAGPRELKVIYSPLHGVGATAVLPVLAEDGFKSVELFGPHSKPDGDFPNVPGHVANPENPQVFDSIIVRAKEAGADVTLATDPDCDRIGCAAPLTLQEGRRRGTRSRAISCAHCLADYVLENRKKAGTLSPQHFIVTTLVTTQMVRRVGDSYGVRTIGDLLVGFKWIAQAIDQYGPELFVYGTEESHGYMAGSYVRDKDGAVASLLLVRVGGQVEGRRSNAAREARFAVLATWRACGEDGLCANAGQRRNDADEGSHGGVPQRSADRDRRRPRRASARLRASDRHAGRRKTGAAGWAKGRSRVSRSGDGGELCRLSAQRH